MTMIKIKIIIIIIIKLTGVVQSVCAGSASSLNLIICRPPRACRSVYTGAPIRPLFSPSLPQSAYPIPPSHWSLPTRTRSSDDHALILYSSTLNGHPPPVVSATSEAAVGDATQQRRIGSRR